MITIFTLSTGRAGTSFLTGLFAANVKNCVALHEPIPVGNVDAIEWYDTGQHGLIAQEFAPKWELIERLAAAGTSVYLESSHLFLKSYCDEAMKHCPAMKLVYLVRDPLEVAVSYSYRDSDGPGSQDGWLIRRILPIFAGLELAEYQKHLVSWIEVQNRAVRFLDRYDKWADCYMLETPWQLNDPTTIASMFAVFGITTHTPTPVIIGNKNANYEPSVYGVDEMQQWVDVLKQIDQRYLQIFRRPCYDRLMCRGFMLLRKHIGRVDN